MRHRRSILLAAMLLGLPAVAQEPERNLQFSGFGTLGLTGTDTHKVGFHRDNGQASQAAAIDRPTGDVDTRIGVQLSSKLSETVLATLQFMSTNQYDNTYRPEVSYACVAWSPLPDLLIRAGDMCFELLPNGDTSNIGYGFLWVRPPVEVFGPLQSSRTRAVDVARSFALGPGTSLELQVSAGQADIKRPVTGVGAWDWTGSPTLGASAKLQAGPLRLRGAFSSVKLASNIPGEFADFQNALRVLGGVIGDPRPGAVADALNTKGVQFRLYQLGGLWESDPWQVQAEVAEQASSSDLFPRTDSGFLSVGYQVGRVMPYLMYARAVTARLARPDLGNLGSLGTEYGPLAAAGRDAAHSVDAILDARVVDQYTWSTGLRWDFANQADLKFQVDWIRSHNATGLLVDFHPLQPSGWNGRMTVLSVTLDFVFGRGLQ
jgi:hypothetical protein